MWRRIVVAIAAVMGIALVGVTAASASHLSINARSFAGLSAHKCSLDQVSVTGAGHVSGNTWSQVAFTGIPAACAGLPLAYVLYQPSGAILRQGTATAVTGSLTVNASSNYDATQVEGVRILLNTWPGNAAWTPPTPPAPADPFWGCTGVDWNNNAVNCTVTYSVSDWGNGVDPWRVVTFNVSPTLQSWTFNINVAAITGLPFSPAWMGSQGGFQAVSCNFPQATLQSAPNFGWGGHLALRASPPSPGFTEVCS